MDLGRGEVGEQHVVGPDLESQRRAPGRRPARVRLRCARPRPNTRRTGLRECPPHEVCGTFYTWGSCVRRCWFPGTANSSGLPPLWRSPPSSAIFVFWYAFESVWCFFAALLSLQLCLVVGKLPEPTQASIGRGAASGTSQEPFCHSAGGLSINRSHPLKTASAGKPPSAPAVYTERPRPRPASSCHRR